MPWSDSDGKLKLRKQISVFIDDKDWRKLRWHSAHTKKPVSHILLDCLRPLLDQLPDPSEGDQ